MEFRNKIVIRVNRFESFPFDIQKSNLRSQNSRRNSKIYLNDIMSMNYFVIQVLKNTIQFQETIFLHYFHKSHDAFDTSS